MPPKLRQYDNYSKGDGPKFRHEAYRQFEILKGVHFHNRIYVKGMLVQQPADNEVKYSGGDKNQNWDKKKFGTGAKFFGYNLLDFDMKHRDRQNSLTHHEEKQAIINAWHEALTKCEPADKHHIEKELYRTLEWRPDCLESQCIKNSNDKHADFIRNQLWATFKSLYSVL